MKFWKKVKWEWANKHWHNTRQKKLARCKAYCTIDCGRKWSWCGRDAYSSVLYSAGEKKRRTKR